MTSVDWPFIIVKFCALQKKPGLGGGFIAILNEVIVMISVVLQGGLPDAVQ